MQDASHGALTVANCLPRLQISLPLLCKVPAFLKGGDCSLWQDQSAHRTPKMQAALVGSWRPHHLCLCVQELPDTQPGEHRLPAASCSSLVPKLWLLHPWQHVLQRGMEILHHWKMPRQQGSSAQARTKGSGDTQSQDELDCPSRAPFSPPQEVY